MERSKVGSSNEESKTALEFNIDKILEIDIQR